MLENKLYADHLLNEINAVKTPCSLMEVCGTHTMAIAKSGLRSLIPPNIKLLSGPGCPVCVTAQGDIDAVIELVKQPGVILTTFGDMMRVPGTESSLQDERGTGADVRVVYSPLDALAIARQNPDKEVVFLGIGFETTAPTVAVTLEQAAEEGLKNFSVWSLHKIVPPAIEAIFSDPEINADGLICPGHVSAVIGIEPYEKLVGRYFKPCVITGFETLDIIEGIYMLVQQVIHGPSEAAIQYKRVVKPQGNIAAREAIERVFKPVNARWRGLGEILGSGLEPQIQFQGFNAKKKFDIPEFEDKPIKGCGCGDVLKGKMTPPECQLFGKGCTPLKPVGPCMVSHEGACAAYYRFAKI
ncbi:MAG: hydrogenase formation protein HypD [Acidobacteriota bacterium]